MEQYTARKLLPFVNDTYFQDSVEVYFDCRLKHLHKELETAEITAISGLQGQIREVRRLLTLRDEVLKEAK